MSPNMPSEVGPSAYSPSIVSATTSVFFTALWAADFAPFVGGAASADDRHSANTETTQPSRRYRRISEFLWANRVRNGG